jgi:hypothetical protein
MGMWDLEKSLQILIKERWKLKGKVDLQLGLNGFFTTFFMEPRERDKMFEEEVTKIFGDRKMGRIHPRLGCNNPREHGDQD